MGYIDALFQDGQLKTAREVLALAQQQGLQGDEVEALALRLEGSFKERTASACPGGISTRFVGSLAKQQENTQDKPTKPDKSPKKSAPHKKNIPALQEINTLVALFNEGRLTEAAALAQAMTVRFPLHEFGWKALGAVFQQMGRSADALAPMQKAAALSPSDVEAHYNLGVTLQGSGPAGRGRSQLPTGATDQAGLR